MRLQEGKRRNLVPPNCLLGVIHCDRDEMVPAAHRVRFTVAACKGGIEMDLHIMKREKRHFDCLNPKSDSWAAAKSILRQGFPYSNRETIDLDRDQTIEPQRMRLTTREETITEIIIRTRREQQL